MHSKGAEESVPGSLKRNRDEFLEDIRRQER